MPTVELFRRFRDLTNAELEAPELLALRNEQSFSSGDDWTALLRCPRVVVLAEGGLGKTVEMREQAKRLMAEGTPAFFVALESLDKEKLSELLSPDESRAFLAWKAHDRSIACFFLDAVDELKLTYGKLERALARLARETDGLLHRMHVVISSRASDWRPSIDMATVWSRLPIPPAQETQPVAREKAFLAALREQEGRRTAEPLRNDEANKSRTVVLLPLSEKQIEIFAHSRGMSDPVAFIAEIRRRDARIFARRPLDLVELVDSWMSNGRLGTRAEQHAANLTVKLKDDPERADRGILSDDKARLGAKRLALAIALTRNRTIRSPDQAVEVLGAEGSLNPSEILTDWTEEERQVLLRRPLFDPAAYGRVRFHHRSVQEYLAARRLATLRHQGTSAKSLRRLLFTERYGVPVVIPSMQPVTAWLALWDEDVRRELMKREPETLLSMGDPESLPMTARARLLRAFAESYGHGGWRGLSIPVDEVRRLAHPELAEVVRELWGATPTNPDVTELLLEVIWQGPIESCADLAQQAALDTNLSAHHRAIAIRALIACRRSVDTRKIAESLLWEPTKWPEPVVYGVADELFPKILGAAELISLIEQTPEPNRTIGGGFSWKMRQIAERVEPWSAQAVKLRDGLADLIWRNRDKKQQWHRLNGRFKYIAPALARLCDRQLDAGVPPLEHANDLIWACVVANRFGQDEIGGKDLAKDLRKHFAGNPILRETAFWTEAALMAEVAPTTDAWERYYRAEQRSLVRSLNQDDRKWLAGALTNGLDLERRSLALQALVGLWMQGGRSEPEVHALRSAVQDDAYLTEELQRRSAPPALDPEYARWQRNERRMNLVAEGRERQRLDGWLRWRTELVADSETAFAPEQLPVTIHNLYAWLQAHSENRNRYNVWDADALREAYSPDIAARAAEAFRALWRAHPPALWSERSPEERNRAPQVWAEALTGLAAEAETSGWADRLSHNEARIAAAYATIELNGFPSWLDDLAAAHPAIVETVIGAELTAEIRLAVEHQHLSTLQDLAYSSVSMKRLLAARLLANLADWPSKFPDKDSGRRSAHHLEQVLQILDNASEGRERATIAAICDTRFSTDLRSPLAPVWLQGLYRHDPERAVEALDTTLTSLLHADRSMLAVAAFANLFAERNALLDFRDQSKRAIVLGRLLRLVYHYVRPTDDQWHDDTPDLRDRAQHARNFLFNALLDTPGPEAHCVISEIATDPVFADLADRLRLLARQRAAKDAEAPPLAPAEVVALEKRFEAPPIDRDGLFAVMVDRLDDLAHDVAHDDFTDRRTLRTIRDESEMQRTLARRLRDMSRGAYVISREDEVADLKKTDIRLAATRGDQKAVIEVKIADKRWSLTDLAQALRTQLVDRYLRHDSCRAGCLLLTYDGTKKYWQHPETRRRLGFAEILKYLASFAEDIEQERGYSVCLAVRGLDLTDPVTAK